MTMRIPRKRQDLVIWVKGLIQKQKVQLMKGTGNDARAMNVLLLQYIQASLDPNYPLYAWNMAHLLTM